MRRSILALALFSLGLVSACGDEPPPSALDAGSETDAGPTDWFASDEPVVAPPACAAPGDGARDVLPLARLSSEGTATTLLQWTREARDALATVRNDVPDDGWLPRAGGVARAELDLAPALGRPVSLRALELTWSAAAPPVQIRARAGCGGALVARIDAGGPRVELGDVCASCLEILVVGDGETRLRAVRLESADPAIELPALAPPPPDVPAIARPDLGVVEGFYGVPWSWDERARMVDAIGRAGLGLYVYAPKDDPLHRARWRTPYDAAFVARFGELAAFAEARGVRAVIAVSPFIDYEDTGADRDALVAKLRAFVDAGAHGIALFADDIEFDLARPIDGALGALHARAVNEVLAAMRERDPDIQLWFVGTVYSDQRLAMWPSAGAYLEALRALDPQVRVLWTGTDTFSPTLAASDLEVVREAIGRRPAIWDNHWANDGGDGFFGRVLLGAFERRDRDLVAATTGIAQNPLIQGGLARLAVGTFAAWAGEDVLDASAMRARAAASELAYASGGDPDDDAALLVRLLETFDAASDGQPSDRALEGALARIAEALQADRDPAVADTRLALERLAGARTLGASLHHSGAAWDLVDELEYPLAKIDVAAQLGLAALERIAAVRAGEDVSERTRALREDERALGSRSRFRWMDDPLDRFADVALALERAGAAARPAVGAPVPRCVAGETLELEPFTGAAEVVVHGLAGARVEGTTVRWTPPHAGRWLGTFVAMPTDAAQGWRTRTEAIVCAP